MDVVVVGPHAHGGGSTINEEDLLEEAISIGTTSTRRILSINSNKKRNTTTMMVVTAVVLILCVAAACIVFSSPGKNHHRAAATADISSSTILGTTTTGSSSSPNQQERKLGWAENVVVGNFLAVDDPHGEKEDVTTAAAVPPVVVVLDAPAADTTTNTTTAAASTSDESSSSSITTMMMTAAATTTSSPSPMPTTKSPTAKPSTRKPTKKPVKPTRSPTGIPTMAPTVMKPFVRGDLAITVASLGIKICTGMSVKLIAKTGQKVTYANGQTSSINFHTQPDGAGIIPVPSTGGYVYVSNSEGNSGTGGVYGVYFDSAGKVTNYTKFLGGTTWNCGGGKTPWDTWVSCEEHSAGQCWQIDPNPTQVKATKTLVGGAGGYFESFAVDNRIPTKPVVFVTEDASNGALRKYIPPESSTTTGGNFDALHTTGGLYRYLVIVNATHFRWSTSLAEGRTSQLNYYSYSEGIDFHNGFLYFVSKTLYKMFILDLDNKTYTTMSTQFGSLGTGGGAFNNQPDQIVRNSGDYLYLTEDGGVSPGIYALHKPTGAKYAIVQGYSTALQYDETSGLAFSPDGKKMYTAFQDCGCLLEFSRDDGLSFDGETLDVKFHTPTQVFRRHV